MKYKKWLFGVVALATCGMLTGCHMSHDWQEATCTTPKTCLTGGETEGEPLGHTWIDATCSELKHCSICGETEGEALEHTWVEVTCAEAKHCSICGVTEGEPLEHTLTEANYQQATTCTVCGETVGDPLQADFEKYDWDCDAELDTTYPYVVPCHGNPEYTTAGKVTFSDYSVFTSDATHEAQEGYEWRAVTVTIIFDDDNARDYGWEYNLNQTDYYDIQRDEESLSVNYNGTDYTECLHDYEFLRNNKSSGSGADVQIRFYERVPIGYDGRVIYVTKPYNGESVYDAINDDTILYRLK